MGIYLPMALTLLIPVGALLGWFYDKWAPRTSNPEFAQRMGVLLATGLIVGESMFGVVFAGDRRGDRSATRRSRWSPRTRGRCRSSIVVFAVVVLGFYAWTRREPERRARTTPRPSRKRPSASGQALRGARGGQGLRRLRPCAPARRSLG